MKVGINVGCAHGGLMDSLSIEKMEEDDDWMPYYTVEVSEEDWALWESFLKLHDHWEAFWNNRMTKGNKTTIKASDK